MSHCTTTHRAARSIEPGDLTTEIDGRTVRLGNPNARCTCTDRESDRLRCDRVGHGVPCDEDPEKWNRAIVQGDVNRAGIPHVDGIFIGDLVVLRRASADYHGRIIQLADSRVNVAYRTRRGLNRTAWATPSDRKASRGPRRLVSARK